MQTIQPLPSITQGRRAHVTLLFSDLCNYVGLGEVSDPEETDAFLRRLQEMAEAIVRRHGGVISQCYGDGILALFGYPEVREDDCRRAVEAALEIHAAARTMSFSGESARGFEVRMHSGVHSGLVFVRGGDNLHGTYDLTGDAVSTASRLSAAAGRDEVLVSAATLQGVEAFFATEPALALTLKGKSTSLLVNRVIERSAVRTRFEARLQVGLTPLAGRTHALARLMAAFDQSCAGEGQTVLVTGPAGIGKTRLLQEFRQRATTRGALVMSGCCDGYGETSPLEPFLQMCKELFGIELSTPSSAAVSAVEQKLAEWNMSECQDAILRMLSLGREAAKGAPLDASANSPQGVLGALVDGLCERGPLVLVLDDWQWADELSQRLMSRIAPHLHARGVLLIIGMRPESLPQAPPRATLTLSLEPLSADEARQIVAVLREQDLDIGLTTALHERSGGNPLYLEELCRSLSDELPLSAQTLEQGGVPNTVQGLIQARVARLEGSPMTTLQRASVIGMEFASALLADAGDRSAQVSDDLRQLVEAGLIYPVASGTTHRFKHGITREVVYASVLINDRRRIHHEIATTLERSVASNSLINQSQALAFHYRGSGDHPLAALHAERAGDQAATSSFLNSARAHYASALESLDRVETSLENKRSWLRVSGKWAAQCAYAPTRAQLKALERADAYARELRDQPALAHNHHMQGWFHYVLGDYGDSIRYCHLALTLAETEADAKLLVQMLTTLGQAYSVSGQYARALAYLNEGIQRKRARASTPSPDRQAASSQIGRSVPPVLYAHSLTCRAMIYGDLGDFERADRDMGEAVSIVEGTGHAMEPSVLSHLAIVQIRRGVWEECHTTASRACKVAERVASTFVFGMCSALQSYSQWRLDPSKEALRHLKRAVDWLEARDFGLYLSFVYTCLAEALYESEQPELAGTYAQRALKRAEQGDPQGEIPAYRVLARLSRQRGDAWQLTEEPIGRAFALADKRASRRELALISLCGAELVAAPGPAGSLAALRERGLMDLEETLAALNEMRMPWYAARAERLLLG